MQSEDVLPSTSPALAAAEPPSVNVPSFSLAPEQDGHVGAEDYDDAGSDGSQLPTAELYEVQL